MVLIPTVKMRTMSYCGKTNLSLSLSLPLSLSENQFILYQLLVECLLISFENFNSRDLLTVPDLKLIKKKKNDIVVRMTYVHFSLQTTFSSNFDFFV